MYTIQSFLFLPPFCVSEATVFLTSFLGLTKLNKTAELEVGAL